MFNFLKKKESSKHQPINIISKTASLLIHAAKIDENYTNNEKIIIEIIWKIVYSDGTNDNYESNLIRRICGLLYISDKDNGIVKIKVQNLLK